MIGMRAGLALIAVAIAPVAMAQGSTTDEIAKYRAALEDGNPAELWEIRGEALWKEPRGPKHASLEGCDLGLGPGVVKGAYAGLPRYFADTDRVLDLESRLVGCMVKLQGFTEAEAQKNPFGNGNAARSDLEALTAYVTSESRTPRRSRRIGSARRSSIIAAARTTSPARPAMATKASASACRICRTS